MTFKFNFMSKTINQSVIKSILLAVGKKKTGIKGVSLTHVESLKYN